MILIKILLCVVNLFTILIICNPIYASDANFDIKMPADPEDPEKRFQADTKNQKIKTVNNSPDSGKKIQADTVDNTADFTTYSVSTTFASGTIINGTLLIRDKSFVIPGTSMIDGKNLTVQYADVTSITILSWKPKQTKKTGSYVFYPERARIVLNDGSEYMTTYTSPFYSFRMDANNRSFTVFSYFYSDKKNGKWYFGREQVSNPSSNPHEKTLSSISFRRTGTGAGFDPGLLRFLTPR